MDLVKFMKAEFHRRRASNARYSLRAFARDLGTNHASLSQMLRNHRYPSARMIFRLGRRLRLPPEAITAACVRQQAEAILRLTRSREFCTHSRWIATRTGIPLDSVNVALQHLLHRGALRMNSANHWKIKGTHHA